MKRDSYHIGHLMENLKPTVTVQAGEHLQFEARLATQLIERWGMVMGKPGGEDSAGRAKIDIMPVDELVTRACDAAQQAAAAFRVRGWVLELPSFEEAAEVSAKLADKYEEEIEERRKKRKP